MAMKKPPVTEVVKSGGRGWTKVECVRALRRRRDHLEARCAIARDEGKNLFFDEQELAALKWALAMVGAEDLPV